jgi:hypothetical protein
MNWNCAAIMLLAIAVGAAPSRMTQGRLPLTCGEKLGIGIGAFCGCMIGAKLPFVLADWDGMASGYACFADGKTIIYGLVGGDLGVDWRANRNGKDSQSLRRGFTDLTKRRVFRTLCRGFGLAMPGCRGNLATATERLPRSFNLHSISTDRHQSYTSLPIAKPLECGKAMRKDSRAGHVKSVRQQRAGRQRRQRPLVRQPVRAECSDWW